MNWQGRLGLSVLLIALFQTNLSADDSSKMTPKRDVVKVAKKSDWLYHTLAINYAALNAVDLLTTLYSLDRGAKEANPIARTFVNNKPLAVVIKGGVTGGVLILTGHLKKRDKRAAYVTLGILNLVYGLVVHNNIGVILELNK